MKTGLVLEGGAMRGMFTAGVMDVMMEHGVTFDGAVGVSAGAVFGCNYKSGQIGRVIRYNKRFCTDRRYVSLRNLILTGDLYGVEFAYNQLPRVLDPFDTESFRTSPMEFYVVCTDVTTGEPVYHKCNDGGDEDITWLRASASMPLAARVVNIDGRLLSDGGTADSIPVRFFQQLGYERNVVVLTQPAGFVKKRSRLITAAKLLLRRYPGLIKAMERRPHMYNQTLEYIREQEHTGAILVIRPPESICISPMVRNPEELERVYQLGRTAGTQRIGELKAYTAR